MAASSGTICGFYLLRGSEATFSFKERARVRIESTTAVQRPLSPPSPARERRNSKIEETSDSH
jgi:hypothetical protein